MEMRLRPATRAAFLRGFLRCLITAWRRNDRFGPAALALSRATSAAFAKASCPFLISRSKDLAITNWQACGGQRSVPFRAQRATNRWGREAAMPGQPVALARVFWNVPRRFTLERIAGCRWLCRNHSASSRNFTFRLEYCQALRCAAQEQNLASLCRNCGGCEFPVEGRGKTRENSGRICCGPVKPRLSIILSLLFS